MNGFDKTSIKNFVKNNNLKTADDVSKTFVSMYKEVLGVMLENEMNEHLGYDKHQISTNENSRNGGYKKKINSSLGELVIDMPRDRDSSYNPVVIPKHARNISEEIESNVISMYGRGLSTRDVSDQVHDIYGVNLSAASISKITETILIKAHEWQARTLDPLYAFIFMDAIHYNVKSEGRIIKKAVYIVLGVNKKGIKDILGIYIGENESCKYWTHVLNDLKNRGVQDILISSVDGLTGFPQAINAVFPNTLIQRCMIHQIRNTLNYISWKDKKIFAKELKSIYNASNIDEGLYNLEIMEEKWEKKYSYVFKSWRVNWPELSTFFTFSPEIRKIMYTTNAIESLNRQYRKVTKNSTIFPNDTSLFKMLYLATKNIVKKWKNPIRNWTQILGQLSIEFPDRIN